MLWVQQLQSYRSFSLALGKCGGEQCKLIFWLQNITLGFQIQDHGWDPGMAFKTETLVAAQRPPLKARPYCPWTHLRAARLPDVSPEHPLRCCENSHLLPHQSRECWAIPFTPNSFMFFVVRWRHLLPYGIIGIKERSRGEF